MNKPITGVFSTQSARRIGAGTTARKSTQRALWFCEEMPNGSFEAQPLNANNVPSGPKRTIPRDEFLATFTPEPELYFTTFSPSPRDTTTTWVRDKDPGTPEPVPTPVRKGRKPEFNERAIRDSFRLGITYLERGDQYKALQLFERLLKIEAPFEPEHKHLLNELGMVLRKRNLPEQAVAYYARAIELSTEDEHLFFNLARACYAQGNADAAITCLYHSLEINADLDPAIRFLFWLAKTDQVPESRRAEVNSFLQSLAGKTNANQHQPGPDPYFDDDPLGSGDWFLDPEAPR